MASNVTKLSGLTDLTAEVEELGKNRKNDRDVQLVFAFCFLISLVSAWHNLMMPFLAPRQNFACDWSNTNNDSIDQKFEIYFQHKLDILNSTQSKPDERCIRYNQNDTVSCENWLFEHSFYARTIVSDWKLVCKREWLVSLGQSIFMAGYVSAMIVFSLLSDNYGRKPTIWIAFGIFLSSGLLCLTASEYVTFTVFRFFVSMGVTGAGTTSFILRKMVQCPNFPRYNAIELHLAYNNLVNFQVMELVDPKARSRYGIGIQFGWSLGFVLIPAMAWLSRDWFYLQLVTTVPALSLIVFWWFIPESPRWSRNVISNNSSPADEMSNCATPKKKLPKATFLDLFQSPNMRKKTLVLFICWFVNSFIYFGLSLGVGNLGGNPFISFLIAGAIEFPAHVGATHLIRIIGRRIPLTMALIVGGLACLLTIPLMTSETLLWLRIFLAMTGKFFITASFSILYVISAELFPTVIRTMGVGSCSLCARIASMVAPFVKELSNVTHPSVPFAVFGCMSIVSGFSVLLLPETKLTGLPDTIKEGEDVR